MRRGEFPKLSFLRLAGKPLGQSLFGEGQQRRTIRKSRGFIESLNGAT
jgi:hypothetical protein